MAGKKAAAKSAQQQPQENSPNNGQRRISDLSPEEFRDLMFAIDDEQNATTVMLPGIGRVHAGNGNWFTKSCRYATAALYTIGALCGIGAAGKLGYDSLMARRSARELAKNIEAPFK